MNRVKCNGDKTWMKDFTDDPCHHYSAPQKLGKERQIVENFLKVSPKLRKKEGFFY